MRRIRLVVGVVIASLALVVTGMSPARADDYSDSDYLAYDLDNMARTGERQGYHFQSDRYREASRDTFLDTWLQGASRQFRDADEGRVYAGLGQILPGGNVGDPEAYHDGPRHEVEFLNREGTKLVGNVWPCRAFLSDGEACPSVVVTTGSIQVTQHMYGWLARHLQNNGYTVFTFDVRGQGESETTDQEDPFGSNPQDGANFQDGTVDALRFLLSSETEPYVPLETGADASSSNADEFNPVSGAVDADHLGLIGHSLGASAVSVVQQCTDVNPVAEADLPATCAGERFSIRAIVAYDSLSASGLSPRVPAFDHRSDGYFINAVPTPSAPDSADRVDAGSAYGQWVAGGQDACSITGRGFTHAEWSQIPYIVSATRYGVPQAKHYTLAWLDRYVHPDLSVKEAGQQALVEGPVPTELPGSHLDHRASLFSGKYASACRTGAVGDAPALSSGDLRAYAGVAGVGEWAAINAEQEYGTAEQGPVHASSALDGAGI